MRVVICGAGQVGYSIASYLAKEENDITVIDKDAVLTDQIKSELDINAITGHASNPEVLAEAGAEEADMLIAVTYSDEVNMVACQVGHSLFNIPKKIARVREQTYLDPAWSNLFSRAHMPIDVIISPEKEVAHAIKERLVTPGTTNVIAFADGRVHLVGVSCKDDCPVVNTQIKQLSQLFPDLNIVVGLIMRGNEVIIPGADDQMLVGDEVFFFTETQYLKRSMTVFGHEETKARSIIVLGGGNVGLYLCQILQKEQKGLNIKVIEHNAERARFLAEKLPDVTVIEGDALDRDILEEANIGEAETSVAVTDDDETNILGSLLAKQYGCERAVSLVTKTEYSSLMAPLGIDAAISPQASTVSKIMKNVRRGRIKSLQTLREGQAEVIEAEVADTTEMANKALKSLELPDDVMLGAVIRDGKVMEIRPELVIKPGDRVITLARQERIRDVEKMFTVHVDLF